jgi:ribosomal protein S18 acetylase RimI-like enzyme
MKLSPPTDIQLSEMMGWFNTENELRDWGGPNFRYPFNSNTFIEDLDLNSISGFTLSSIDSEFRAFGQCYNRLNRCHLGRLAVSPNQRGKGIIIDLMDLLSEYGFREFSVSSMSLFVVPHNRAAIKAYKNYGFQFTEYPGKMPMKDCFYMVKE